MTLALLILAVALTVGAVIVGVTALIDNRDEGLRPVEPDGAAVPLPADRPLVEADLDRVRFDLAPRGYRMAQVDAALRRAAYDVGYKEELIRVLQAEVDALRDGRLPDAEALRQAREAAAGSREAGQRPDGGPPDVTPHRAAGPATPVPGSADDDPATRG